MMKAYGLSAFPIGIIKGKKHLAEEFSATAAKANQTREQVNAIQSKYLAGGKKMSQKDQEQLDLLKRKERYTIHSIQQSQFSLSSKNFCKTYCSS